MNNLELFNWFEDLLTSFSNIGNWLITPLGNGLPSPLILTTSAGLLIFLGIAIVKWIFS